MVAGSAAFSLYYEFNNVLLNDANPALINLYRQLSNGLEINTSKFELTPEFYYAARDELNIALINNRERLGAREAELFWYLCKHSFNGLVRQSQKGNFNMPVGAYDQIASPPDTRKFKAVTKNWKIECGCFTKLDVSNADLILIDPPYEKTFNSYTSDKNEDLQANIFSMLSAYDGAAIVTNTFIPELTDTYRQEGFSVYKTPVRRSISCKGSSRGQAFEMLALRGFSTKQFRRYMDNLTPYYRRTA